MIKFRDVYSGSKPIKKGKEEMTMEIRLVVRFDDKERGVGID